MSLGTNGCITCINHLPKLAGSSPRNTSDFQCIKNSFYFHPKVSYKEAWKNPKHIWKENITFLEFTMEYLWKTKNCRSKNWLFILKCCLKFSMVLKKICEKNLQPLQKSFTENFLVAWKNLFGYAATDNLACLTRKTQALILRKLRKSWS